jgi:hypothetical protein
MRCVKGRHRDWVGNHFASRADAVVLTDGAALALLAGELNAVVLTYLFAAALLEVVQHNAYEQYSE